MNARKIIEHDAAPMSHRVRDRVIPSVGACSAAVVALACMQALASDAPIDGLYDITIETSMPHLEENLRYTTERDRRCLTRAEVLTIFPTLRSSSLADCRFADERRNDDTVTWALLCTGGHGTTGSAIWRFNPPHLVGQLNVKLGGKNMTFYQRATLKRVGACEGFGH